MTDTHNTIIRRFNMSQIKNKNTKPEMIVRKFLFSKGLRYKLHTKQFPGTPDIVVKKYNTVIFVNGCFWHGHTNCNLFRLPKTNTEWWMKKISKNKEKDFRNINEMKNLGWNVIVIWECELRPNQLKISLDRVINNII